MNYKILIIDDNPEIIQQIVGFLEEEHPDFYFFYANNGETGFTVALKHKPDLIIVDWELPGISGIETIKRLKEEQLTRGIPVIMITGIMTSSAHLKTALDAGSIDYLRKPIDKIELKARINSMLTLIKSYQNLINIRNEELASKTLQIAQENEFHQHLLKQIRSIRESSATLENSNIEDLKNIEQALAEKINIGAWTNFEAYFKNVHPFFYNNILKQFPILTPSELRLAALLRLNLSSKEISSLIYIAPESVKTARKRLRKKLQLQTDDNLVSFLQRF